MCVRACVRACLFGGLILTVITLLVLVSFFGYTFVLLQCADASTLASAL